MIRKFSSVILTLILLLLLSIIPSYAGLYRGNPEWQRQTDFYCQWEPGQWSPWYPMTGPDSENTAYCTDAGIKNHRGYDVVNIPSEYFPTVTTTMEKHWYSPDPEENETVKGTHTTEYLSDTNHLEIVEDIYIWTWERVWIHYTPDEPDGGDPVYTSGGGKILGWDGWAVFDFPTPGRWRCESHLDDTISFHQVFQGTAADRFYSREPGVDSNIEEDTFCPEMSEGEEEGTFLFSFEMVGYSNEHDTNGWCPGDPKWKLEIRDCLSRWKKLNGTGKIRAESCYNPVNILIMSAGSVPRMSAILLYTGATTALTGSSLCSGR